MFKKILSVLLVVASLFTLASCGKESDVSYIDGCVQELGQYKGLNIEIAESELEFYKVKLFKNNAAYVTTTSGTIGKIDTIIVTITVTCDGKDVTSLNLTDGVVSLGTGGNIKGFDEQVIGHKVGRLINFKLTLPEDFPEEEFAGKEVDYIVRASSIRSYPSIDDATVKEAMYSNYGISTVNDFNIYAKNTLFVEKLVQQIMDTTKINHLVQDDVDDGVQYYNEYYASMYLQQVQAGYMGSFSEYCQKYLGQTVEELEVAILKESQTSAKFMLVMYALCEAEGYVATDDDIKEVARSSFAEYGYATPRAFIRGEGKEVLRYTITQQDLSEMYMFLRYNNTLVVK